jgi:hypothetical protein
MLETLRFLVSRRDHDLPASTLFGFQWVWFSQQVQARSACLTPESHLGDTSGS